MVITIGTKDGSKDYDVKFGVAFVRALDEKYFLKNQAGVKFGNGLESRLPSLLSYDVIALAEFLYEGTCTESPRPKLKEIDAFIDGVEDIEELFNEVEEELKKHNATRLKYQKIRKLLDEEEAKAKKTS